MHGPLGTALRGLASVVLLGTVGLVPVAAAAPAGPAARLEEVSVVREPTAVVVKVRTSARARYVSNVIGSPPRVIVDFQDTRYAWREAPWAVGEPPVKEVRGSQFRRGVARVVVELTERVAVRVVPRPDGVHIVVPTVGAAGADGRAGTIAAAPAAGARDRSSPPPSAPTVSRDAAAEPDGPGTGQRSATGSAAAPGPASGLRLQGIVVVDGVAVAYIEEPPARSARGYRVGDPIGDGRVDSISVDTVVIRRPAGEVELKITPPGGPAKP